MRRPQPGRKWWRNHSPVHCDSCPGSNRPCCAGGYACLQERRDALFLQLGKHICNQSHGPINFSKPGEIFPFRIIIPFSGNFLDIYHSLLCISPTHGKDKRMETESKDTNSGPDCTTYHLRDIKQDIYPFHLILAKRPRSDTFILFKSHFTCHSRNTVP